VRIGLFRRGISVQQVPQIAPSLPEIRPAAPQRKGGGFADLLDTMDAGPRDASPPERPSPARDDDASDAEPVKTRRRTDHAGRRHETRSERHDTKTAANKTDADKTGTDQAAAADDAQAQDAAAAGKPKEQDGKDTEDSTDAAIDPRAVESVPAPSVQTGMIEAAVLPAPALVETGDTPVLPADASAEIEAPQKAAPQMPAQAAAPQVPDGVPEDKQTADAAQPAKKNEAALPRTKDAAPAADAKPALQAAKDIAALNPQANDAARVGPEAAPKLERPAVPDASAVRAGSDDKSLDGNSDAKPASETRAAKQPENALANQLAKQFGATAASADSAPVTLPDAARAAQNNFTAASVTVQTAAMPMANQPVPLQAAALAIEIASRARDGMREFQIRLDPPELGRVDVKLNVDKHGQVNTHLTVDRPETLDLLRRDAQSLERALQQSGLKTSDGNLEFSLRQQTPDGFNQRQARPQPDDANGVLAVDADAAGGIHAEYQWAARLRGGVDIRV
jgi:chemotaxis protein MotD